MNRNQLKNELVAQLERRCAEYRKKCEQYRAELKADRRDLELVYGAMAVEQMLKLMGAEGKELGGSRSVSDAAPKKKVKKAKRRRKRQSLAKTGQPNFTETKRIVLEKLRSMKLRTQFTSQDLCRELKEGGYNLVPDYVSVAISQHVKGVEKVGTRVRASGSGAPLNLYEIRSKSLEFKKRV